MGAEVPQHFLDYIQYLPRAHQLTLVDLRKITLKEIVEQDEVFRWKVPAFRYRGKLVAGIGAWRHHVGVYVMYGKALQELKQVAPDLDVSEKVLRLDPTRPIPTKEIRKVMRFRLAEIVDF